MGRLENQTSSQEGDGDDDDHDDDNGDVWDLRWQGSSLA